MMMKMMKVMIKTPPPPPMMKNDSIDRSEDDASQDENQGCGRYNRSHHCRWILNVFLSTNISIKYK
jgi:hypothetical protein